MRFRRTPAQIAAARRNGALSHVPVTPEGKQNVSQNACKHGAYAKGIFLPGESEAEFFRLGSHLNTRFKPRDPVESIYVQRTLVAQWRYLRVWNLEQAGVTSKLDDDPDQNPTLAHLESFLDVHGASQKFSLLAAETRFLCRSNQTGAEVSRLCASSQLKNFKTNPASNTKQKPTREKEGPESHPPATPFDPPATRPDPPATRQGPELFRSTAFDLPKSIASLSLPHPLH